MVFTFFKAMGLETGSSLVEDNKLELALSLLEQAKARNIKLMLPEDVIAAPELSPTPLPRHIGQRDCSRRDGS